MSNPFGYLVDVSLDEINPKKGSEYAELKVFINPASVRDFPDSCVWVLEVLQHKRNTGKPGITRLETLVVRVNLPEKAGRWAVDWLLYLLFNSLIYWDTLKIIMPYHKLDLDVRCYPDLDRTMSANPGQVRELAVGHLARTQLVYEGADENVPWPWININRLSRIEVRSLALKQKISTAQYAELLQHTLFDTVNPATDSGLEWHILGLTRPGCDDGKAGPQLKPASTPRSPVTINLGRLDPGVLLRDAVGTESVQKSMENLTVDVSLSLIADGQAEVEDITSLTEALRACTKLQTVKVRCRLQYAEKIKMELSSWMLLASNEEKVLPNGKHEIVAYKRLP